MDIMVTHTPAIVVPFQQNSELEQITRANIFEQQGLVTVIKEKDFNEGVLMNRIEELLSGSNANSTQPSVKMNGARCMTEFLLNL